MITAHRFSVGFISGEFSTVNQRSSNNVRIFRVHGYRSQVVRRSNGEPLRPRHIQQASKYPHMKMFCCSFNAKGTFRLINVEGMMNNDKYKADKYTY